MSKVNQVRVFCGMSENMYSYLFVDMDKWEIVGSYSGIISGDRIADQQGLRDYLSDNGYYVLEFWTYMNIDFKNSKLTQMFPIEYTMDYYGVFDILTFQVVVKGYDSLMDDSPSYVDIASTDGLDIENKSLMDAYHIHRTFIDLTLENSKATV